jgi:lysophospholipase L1-like esterase
MTKKITWNDKVGVIPYLTREIQVQDRDMNEIKDVINSNADILDVVEEKNITGIEVVSTFADEGGGLPFLPATGVLGISYKVAKDPDTAKNGYYHWSGSIYIRDEDLANGVSENGNVDPISGGTSFKYSRDFNKYDDTIIINEYIRDGGVFDNYPLLISGTKIWGNEVFTPKMDGLKIKTEVGGVVLSIYKVNINTGASVLLDTAIADGTTQIIPLQTTFLTDEYLGVSGNFGFFYNTEAFNGFNIDAGVPSKNLSLGFAFSAFTSDTLNEYKEENEFIFENHSLLNVNTSGIFLNESGAEVSDASWGVSGYIDVIGLNEIYISAHVAGGTYGFCVFYDNLGGVISVLKKSSIPTGVIDELLIELPVGTETVRFTIQLFQASTFDFVVKKTTVVSKVDELNKLLGGAVEWVAMGDSITTGVGSTTGLRSYVDIMENMFTDVVVVKSNFTGQTIRNQLMTSYLDITSETKIVTMFYGTNDARDVNTSLFGDVATVLAKPYANLLSGATSMESLRLFIEDVKRNFPSVLIYVFTPMKSTLNFKTEIDLFISKEIELCNYMGVPIIDMFNNSGITWEDSIYTGDDLHPNDDGYLLMARYISTVINLRNAF